jgi:hypothetical protein
MISCREFLYKESNNFLFHRDTILYSLLNKCVLVHLLSALLPPPILCGVKVNLYDSRTTTMNTAYLEVLEHVPVPGVVKTDSVERLLFFEIKLPAEC